MQFLFRAYDGEGKLDKRMEVHPHHLESVINRMEQYLMYQKAFLFEDSDIAAQILDTKA